MFWSLGRGGGGETQNYLKKNNKCRISFHNWVVYKLRLKGGGVVMGHIAYCFKSCLTWLSLSQSQTKSNFVLKNTTEQKGALRDWDWFGHECHRRGVSLARGDED